MGERLPNPVQAALIPEFDGLLTLPVTPTALGRLFSDWDFAPAKKTIGALPGHIAFNLAFERAPFGIAILLSGDESNLVLGENTFINPAFERITGYDIKRLVELGWTAITHPDDVESNLKLFDRLKTGEIESYSLEKRFVRPDGSFAWISLTVVSLSGRGVGGAQKICFAHDITERHELEAALRNQSERDALTGLFNRRVLLERLGDDARVLKGAKRALVGINIDSAAALSLERGYSFTCELIFEAVWALMRHCDKTCQLFSVGDYRFIIYVKGYDDVKRLEGLGRDILHSIGAILSPSGISAGVGLLEIGEGAAPDRLLDRLLMASAQSIKLSGENSAFCACFYDEHLASQALRRERIFRCLAEVLSGKGDSRLAPVFQPIFGAESGKIRAFEALARLECRDLGLVMPGEFIPLAETARLMPALGRRMLKAALGLLCQMKRAGCFGVAVTVNASVLELMHPGFLENLGAAIKEFEVLPGELWLEVTESVFRFERERINRVLSSARDMGIVVAIDDFGTGYSTLARERELAVDVLKIDRLFVEKLGALAPDEAITGDIVAMAKKMGHMTVAEGVEDERQKQMLIGLGCDMLQGFHLARPMSQERALELARSSCR